MLSLGSLKSDEDGIDFASMRYVVAIVASLAILGLVAEGWFDFNREVESIKCLGELETILDSSRELNIQAPPGCTGECGSRILRVTVPQGCECVLGAPEVQPGLDSYPYISSATLPNGSVVTLWNPTALCDVNAKECNPVFLGPGTHYLTLKAKIVNDVWRINIGRAS